MLHFIGVDPGKSGGFAVLSQDGRIVVTCKMPEKDWEILGRMKSIIKQLEERVWFVELIHAMPAEIKRKDGSIIRMRGAASQGSFLKHAGMIEGILMGLGESFELVSPLKWQNALDCRTRGDKTISRARASELFQSEKVTHAIGDALLIAEYGRRLTLGLIH